MPTYYSVLAGGGGLLHSTSNLAGSQQIGLSTASGSASTSNPGMSSNNAAGSAGYIALLVTSTNNPANASWPSGKYTGTVECQGTGASVTYGLLAVGSSGTGHWGRTSSDNSSEFESTVQAQAAFTGTGVKSSSCTWTPSGGSATDRLEVFLAGRNTGTMSSTFGHRYGTSSHTFTMPSSGGAAAADPLRFTLMGAGR